MRSDKVAFISASRILTEGLESSERKRICLYRVGEKQPGKDRWQYLCEQCPLPDCIREEGDMTATSRWREYPGCLIWEAARKEKRTK